MCISYSDLEKMSCLKALCTTCVTVKAFFIYRIVTYLYNCICVSFNTFWHYYYYYYYLPFQSNNILVMSWASLTMETPRLEELQLSYVQPSYRLRSPKHVSTYTLGWPVCRVQQVCVLVFVLLAFCKELRVFKDAYHTCLSVL